MQSCLISLFNVVNRVNILVITFCIYFLVDFTEINMPPKMLQRGRPKGANLTTIGLPAKRKRADKLQKRKRPTLFINKSSKDKEECKL